MDAACNLATDPALVQAKYEAMLEHQREWSADRGAALAIRRSLEQADSSAIYARVRRKVEVRLVLAVTPRRPYWQRGE